MAGEDPQARTRIVSAIGLPAVLKLLSAVGVKGIREVSNYK
jgi:hypothetical protein